jgi:hypothetical protein
MYQNNLTKKYQAYLNQPIQFMNNQLFNNNPIYTSNINDQNFCQQMMLQREEQMKRIRNVSDLGLTREQITEYVIAPIKIEKSDSSEIERLMNDETSMMTKDFIEKNWWNSRTNAPYKNILKDEDWKKEFKSQKDLIVHKVTNLDKIGLMEDYEALLKIIETHNGQLKTIFSSSKENEHKKAFKFVQKYRDRMKYNPKDYNDLKEYYKKEQKKHDRNQKSLEDAITRLMDDDMDEKELKQLESEFIKPSKSKKNKSKLSDREKEIDEQIKELVEEYGEDVLKDLEKDDSDEEKKKEKERDEKKKNVNERCVNVNVNEKDENIEDTKPKVRVRRCIKGDDQECDKNDNMKDSGKKIKITTRSPDINDKRVVINDKKDISVGDKSDQVKRIRIRSGIKQEKNVVKNDVQPDVNISEDKCKGNKKIRIVKKAD